MTERLNLEEMMEDLSKELEGAPEGDADKEDPEDDAEDQADDADDSEGSSAPDEDGDSEKGEPEIDASLTPEEQAEARRIRNREKRQRNKERKQAYLDSVRAENALLRSRLEETERKVEGVQKQQVDSSLSAYEHRIREAKTTYDKANNVLSNIDAKLAEAQAAGDSAAIANLLINKDKAREIRDQASNEGVHAVNEYQKIQSRTVAKKPEAAKQAAPELVNHPDTNSRRQTFLSTNKKILDGLTQAQTRRLYELDASLAQQGFDMRTDGYWGELTSRMKKEFGLSDTAQQRPKSTVGGKGQAQPQRTQFKPGELPAGVIKAWRQMGQDVDNPKELEKLKRNYFAQQGRQK